MANDKEAKNKKETKNKKSFFKDFKAELKKVIWPTPKQLINSTTAVIVIVIITAAIVLVLDIAFDMFNKYGINNLKSLIRGNENVQIEEHNHNQVENEIVDANNVVVDANNVIVNETISE